MHGRAPASPQCRCSGRSPGRWSTVSGHRPWSSAMSCQRPARLRAMQLRLLPAATVVFGEACCVVTNHRVGVSGQLFRQWPVRRTADRLRWRWRMISARPGPGSQNTAIASRDSLCRKPARQAAPSVSRGKGQIRKGSASEFTPLNDVEAPRVIGATHLDHAGSRGCWTGSPICPCGASMDDPRTTGRADPCRASW